MNESIVGSCNCLTKTPEANHHDPGCMYRLIVERGEAIRKLAMCREKIEGIAACASTAAPTADPEARITLNLISDEAEETLGATNP